MVEGYVVDCWWPEQRVVAEVDGFAFHKTRQMFERDRKDDATLQLAKINLLRPTQRRIEHEPEALLSDLARMLGGSVSGPGR